MKRYSEWLITAVIVLFASGTASGQSNKDSAISIFKNCCYRYNNAEYLSFRMSYEYRNATTNKLLDSVFGRAMIDKQRYHIILANTETIENGKYNIMLFADDTLMYISRSGFDKKMSSPVALIDTALLTIANMDISLKQHKRQQAITINFPEGMDYKKAVFVIDKATGYLQNVKYTVKSTLLLDPEEIAAAENDPSINEEWSIVQSNFFRYETGKFTDNEFDDRKYFIKQGKEFKTTAAYKQYKIFIASPGL